MKRAYFSLCFLLSTTEIPGHYIKQIEDSELWKVRRGRQVNDLRIQEKISGDFPSISFCLIYPRVADKKNGNSDTFIADKKVPKICVLCS